MISEEQIMTDLGQFVWSVGAAVLCIVAHWAILSQPPSEWWSTKTKRDQFMVLIVGSVLIIAGFVLQIMGL